MRLTERTDALCTKSFRDKNRNLWKYIPVKQADGRRITPKDIAGDTGCRSGKTPVGILTGRGRSGKEEKKLYILPFRAKPGYSQREAGYIPCEDEEGNLRYVRVMRKSAVKLLLPVFLLALMAGGLGGYLLWQGRPVLEESAVAYQMPGGVKNEESDEILVPGFGTITMDADSTTVHAALANPEGNPCYFKYRIRLSDTGEQIYESGWLEPGTAVTEWDISEKLPEGEYPVQILVQTASLENYKEEMNQGVVNAALVVR